MEPALSYIVHSEYQFSQFSCSVMSTSATPWIAARQPPCPSPTSEAYSNSCPSRWWCHTIFSSLSSPSPPAFNLSQHQSFPMSQFFASDGQSIGVSASTSILTMNIQDWFPLELTGLICLQSKGLSRVFSNTTFKSINLSLLWTPSSTIVNQQSSHLGNWLMSQMDTMGRKHKSELESQYNISWS